VIDGIFKSIKMDEYGNPMISNIGVINYYNPVVDNQEEPIYTDNIASFVVAAKQRLSDDRIFVFNYDWRIDIRDNAGKLKEYINYVRAASGCKKVSLVSGGYGGAIVNAYLYYNEKHSKNNIASCVFLDSFADGSSIIGDVMSGDLIRTVSDALHDLDSIFDLEDVYGTLQGEDVGAAFARYMNSDPTGMLAGALRNMLGTGEYSDIIAALALSLASFIIEDEGMFAKLGSGYRDIIMQSDELIYDAGLREYMRNMPGLWAAVPEEYYDSAVSFMFGDEEIDPALKEKMDHGREVMYATEVTLNALQTAGVNLNIVAGYNHQMIPITAQINEQSDGYQATRYAGIGAKTGDIDKGLSTQERCTNGNHNHMEPGRAVDASTCFFPENTWFIKNHKHNIYSAPTVAEFVAWLVFSDTQRTVWQHELYPQYLQESLVDGSLSPYSTYKAGDEQNFSYGDLDFDGVVSASDARLALRYAVGLDKVSSRIVEMIGNVDGKAGITAEDARLILRYAVGLEKKFPVEK
jgi:hypothetical protein